VPNTGVEARGEYVFVSFGNPANLRANNDTDSTNNVGKTMYAIGELAYHLAARQLPVDRLGAVPFYRYSFLNIKPADRRQRPQCADRRRPNPVPHCRRCGSRRPDRFEGDVAEVINRDPAAPIRNSVLGRRGIFYF